jgi:hypothetical protein
MPLRNEQYGPTAVIPQVNLNAVADTVVSVPFAKWYPINMRIYDASTSLAASSMTIGLYSAAAAGGTAIVTPATRTALTTAAQVVGSTIASTTYFTTPNVYIRVAVVHGSAATATVALDLLALE